MDDLFPETIESIYKKSAERIISAYELSQAQGKGKLYVAFSGGKDSVAVYGICKLAAEMMGRGVLDICEFHYNVTCVDPPELVQFIKREFPFVIMDNPSVTMWELIPKKLMPPTRLVRYCCQELKEKGGKGRFCVTGVRWAESLKRRNLRGVYEKQNSKGFILFDDNDEGRRALEHCIPKGKFICNPIVDWSDEEVWMFIKDQKLPYCGLYDQGHKRLGCIGCPMGTKKQRVAEFERWPTYKRAYIRAFEKMLKEREEKGLKTEWKTGEEVFTWWISR